MNNKPSDTLDRLFRLSNLIVLPFWLLMVLAPRWQITRKLMNNNVIFLVLGSFYTSLLATGVASNPAGMKDVMNPNLDGLVKLFGSRQSVVTGWAHFLTMDLFVGRWIYLDAIERNKTARLPLLATFMAGPLGILLYFVRRPRK